VHENHVAIVELALMRHSLRVVVRRVPGEGRYAQIEREQRWLLSRLPEGLAQPRHITDRYLVGTRLRLRRVEAGAEVAYKLGQKVRLDECSPQAVKLTNVYLSTQEYEVLRQLPAEGLLKTRWSFAYRSTTLSVDEFAGPLSGLILAEIDVGGGESTLNCPDFAVADVTMDDRFSGGSLAKTTCSELRRLLEAFLSAGTES